MIPKKIKLIFTLTLLAGLLPAIPYIFATDFSSTDFSVTNPVIDAGTATTSSLSFGLGQSLSQIAIGQSTSTSFKLYSGFQYFFSAGANTLSTTAGNNQISLSWSVPTTHLGVNVSSYEVGFGTVSGSYTFTDVGNVTSYI